MATSATFEIHAAADEEVVVPAIKAAVLTDFFEAHEEVEHEHGEGPTAKYRISIEKISDGQLEG